MPGRGISTVARIMLTCTSFDSALLYLNLMQVVCLASSGFSGPTPPAAATSCPILGRGLTPPTCCSSNPPLGSDSATATTPQTTPSGTSAPLMVRPRRRLWFFHARRMLQYQPRMLLLRAPLPPPSDRRRVQGTAGVRDPAPGPRQERPVHQRGVLWR